MVAWDPAVCSRVVYVSRCVRVEVSAHVCALCGVFVGALALLGLQYVWAHGASLL